jgi:spoIIIJ-associated protein
MLKVEADTLEEAYIQASSKLECSITQLHFEIIQHPKTGFLGMFKKTAIIVATCKNEASQKPQKERTKKPKPVKTVKPQRQSAPKPEPTPYEPTVSEPRYSVEDDAIFDNFYDEKKCDKKEVCTQEIEQSVKRLFSTMCFELDSIAVSMLDEATVFINIQGKDAALLIGKEGYRYKAISYMLFNWINAKYGLLTRVEIAQFLESQEKMIANYIKPVIAQIEQNGKGSTKPLDGILVQIALKQLRRRFPDKYVGIKSNNFDEKYIIVNDFKK